MTTRFFGQRITRNEDPRLLTGQALFVDDVALPDDGTHRLCAQPLCACPDRRDRHHQRTGDAGGDRHLHRRGSGGLLATGAAAGVAAADRALCLPPTDPVPAGQGQGAAPRRSGRRGGGHQPLRRRGRGRRGGSRLRSPARGGRPRAGTDRRRPPPPRRSRAEPRGPRHPGEGGLRPGQGRGRPGPRPTTALRPGDRRRDGEPGDRRRLGQARPPADGLGHHPGPDPHPQRAGRDAGALREPGTGRRSLYRWRLWAQDHDVLPRGDAGPWISLQLGRPIKWIEDREENFTATTQERGQIHDAEMALDQRRQDPRASTTSSSTTPGPTTPTG